MKKLKNIDIKEKSKDFLKFIKLNFKKYFSTNILFISFVILSLFIAYTVRVYTIGNFFEIKPIIVDLSIIIIIGAFGYLIKPKNQFKYFMIWLCFFTFLGIANAIYYEFFISFVSVNLISAIGLVSDVDDSVADKLNILHFIYLLAPIIFFIIHKKLYKKNYYFEVSKVEKGKKMFLKTLIVGGAIIGIIFLTLSGTEVSRFVKQWNREYIVQRFGIYTYTFNDLIQSVQPKINTLFGYDEAAREFREFYNNKEDTPDNEYTDIFKGKNVIFIHGESIQNFLVDLEFNGEEVTPNINKLSHEGMYFSNFYPQISVGTSSDTEFTLTTGLMPSNSGTVFVSYFNRTFRAMPMYFNDLGYYTFSMHGNKADFWNRKVMHKNLGYKRFYSEEDFDVDEIVGLGLSDKSFFKQITPIISGIKEEKAPFMSTVITLSNHSPFNDVEKYGEYDVTMKYETTDETGKKVTETAPYLEDTEMGRYLKSAHYADEAFGEFMTYLDEAGILDDTVIVFYGDHEARLGKSQFDRMYNYDPETDSIKDEDDPTYIEMESYEYELLKETPFIIWTKDKKYQQEVTDVMGMYDVLPTIGNLFGFYPQYALGNDIFSDSEKIVIFPNGNFLTNKVFYNNLKDEYVSLKNEAIDREYIDRLKQYTDERLAISNSIIVHDLINTEEGNLDK